MLAGLLGLETSEVGVSLSTVWPFPPEQWQRDVCELSALHPWTLAVWWAGVRASYISYLRVGLHSSHGADDNDNSVLVIQKQNM